MRASVDAIRRGSLNAVETFGKSRRRGIVYMDEDFYAWLGKGHTIRKTDGIDLDPVI